MTSYLEPNVIEKLKEVKLFLLDLDGTVYLEDMLIPGVREFVNQLVLRNISYVFLTNNSSRSTQQYLQKLCDLGIPVTPKNILTSGQTAAVYIRDKKPGASLFVVGTDSYKRELCNYGFELLDSTDKIADYVLVGFDTELTYKKLEIACKHIHGGAGFIATNPDLVCPLKSKTSIPDCGSICLLLQNATGKQPVFVGKPHTNMIEILRKTFRFSSQSMAIIGDRLYTDIALACNAGIMSICVLSGETTVKDISSSFYRPDVVVDSIDILNGIFN